MNNATRRRMWIGAAYASGILAMMLALDSDTLTSHTPYLKLTLLSLCIGGLALCLRAIHRIDHSRSDDPRKPLRAALTHKELRGTASLPLSLAVGTPLMALFISTIAYSYWRAANYPVALFMTAFAVTLVAGWIWLLRHRLQPRELRIDAAGIHSPDFGLIDWHDIVGIRRNYIYQFGRHIETLQVCVRDPARYRGRLPVWMQRVSGQSAASNRRYAPLAIMLNGYGIAIDTAYVTTLALRRRIASAFVEDWEPTMSDAEIDGYLVAHAPVAAARAQPASAAAPGATFPQRLQAQQNAGATLSTSQARQHIRHRARKRRWHEGAWRRGVIAVLGVVAYVLVKGWLEGLFD
ncbi:hypothetical protein [Lysobacter capsici]|uniref:hypothetical protein n=1 Tax=Lysobacter capsici TaxID=435897 RepID=UPI00128FD034|nr:hypothetical protein [Lysobacter capsici]